jgi:protein TonB
MIDTVQRVDAPPPADESAPRKGSNALLWLLLLLAVLAAVWFLQNRSASDAITAAPPATPAIGGDAQRQAAQAERERADANASRKAVRGEIAKSSTQAAKPRLANRGPEPVAGIRPEYPPAAYRAGEEGSVLVRADVDASGVPGNVSLVRRSGSRDLDRAAVDAVRASHFRPAIRDGQAVASSIEVPVDFRLAER